MVLWANILFIELFAALGEGEGLEKSETKTENRGRKKGVGEEEWNERRGDVEKVF